MDLIDHFPPEIQTKVMGYYYAHVKAQLKAKWKPPWNLDLKTRRIVYYSISVQGVERLRDDRVAMEMVRLGLVQRKMCWVCGNEIQPYPHSLDHLFWVICCEFCYFTEDRGYLRSMHGRLPYHFNQLFNG